MNYEELDKLTKLAMQTPLGKQILKEMEENNDDKWDWVYDINLDGMAIGRLNMRTRKYEKFDTPQIPK